MKPDKYLIVWAQIFSKLEKGEGSMFVYEITARNRIPSPTLKRILDYGINFSEIKLDYKWSNKILTFSSFVKDSEIKKEKVV